MRSLPLIAAVIASILAPVCLAVEPPREGQKLARVVEKIDVETGDDLANIGHGQIDRRYDFTQSFKKPFFIFPDSSDKKVPFFTHSGDTMASNDNIRLTPSLPMHSGSIWADEPNMHKDWQMHFSFRAAGRGYAGGDGLALWYSKEKGVKGPVMGSKDKWNGLGLVFSTSSKLENRYSPLIYGIVNDGNKEVNGRTDYMQSAAGSCLRDYRNTPHAVWVRVTYKKRQLRVDVDLYKDGYQFIECFRAKDIDLPPGYFFGVSASTGQTMHDDHDILGLEVFEVNPHPRKSKSKFQDEYKISNDVKQSFEEAKKAIEDVEHDLNAEQTYEGSEAETFNPAIVQHLQENQFKIIEALNVLEQKVINSPQIAATNSHEKASAGVASAVAPVDAKVEAIRSKIDELEDKLVTLDRDIKELFNVIRTGNSQGQMKMSEVARKLDESNNKIKSAHDAIASSQGKDGAGVGSIAMYGLFFMIGGVAVYAVSVVLRMRSNNQPKKYI
ncbi:legume-like lectin family-domain-containing protein [Chytriomyces cf. hyalinus JEL632]|nr:legume-like lectin family-domain-containing protein [Chytriomyces cf. hyalinus JEL632]